MLWLWCLGGGGRVLSSQRPGSGQRYQPGLEAHPAACATGCRPGCVAASRAPGSEWEQSAAESLGHAAARPEAIRPAAATPADRGADPWAHSTSGPRPAGFVAQHVPQGLPAAVRPARHGALQRVGHAPHGGGVPRRGGGLLRHEPLRHDGPPHGPHDGLVRPALWPVRSRHAEPGPRSQCAQPGASPAGGGRPGSPCRQPACGRGGGQGPSATAEPAVVARPRKGATPLPFPACLPGQTLHGGAA